MKIFSLEGDMETVTKRAIRVGGFLGAMTQMFINAAFGTEYFDYPSASTASGMTFDIIWHKGWPYRQTLNFSKTLHATGNSEAILFLLVNFIVNVAIWIFVSMIIFWILKAFRQNSRTKNINSH